MIIKITHFLLSISFFIDQVKVRDFFIYHVDGPPHVIQHVHLVSVSIQIKLIILPHLIKYCIELNLLPSDLPQISIAEKFIHVFKVYPSLKVCQPASLFLFSFFFLYFFQKYMYITRISTIFLEKVFSIMWGMLHKKLCQQTWTREQTSWPSSAANHGSQEELKLEHRDNFQEL